MIYIYIYLNSFNLLYMEVPKYHILDHILEGDSLNHGFLEWPLICPSQSGDVIKHWVLSVSLYLKNYKL